MHLSRDQGSIPTNKNSAGCYIIYARTARMSRICFDFHWLRSFNSIVLITTLFRTKKLLRSSENCGPMDHFTNNHAMLDLAFQRNALLTTQCNSRFLKCCELNTWIKRQLFLFQIADKYSK